MKIIINYQYNAHKTFPQWILFYFKVYLNHFNLFLLFSLSIQLTLKHKKLTLEHNQINIRI